MGETLLRVNPFLTREAIGMRILEELQEKLTAYNAEENLRPANIGHRLQNGINPYHTFLE